MISNYLKHINQIIIFYKIVIIQFFIILFKRKKKIELLLLEYDTEHLFDNSYIVINYRFENAIYYCFGKHKTAEKHIKIFNIKNFDTKFDLTVYGFFQKKTYLIEFEPKLSLNSDSFKTKLSNLSLKIEEKSIPNLVPSFHLVNKKPKIKHPKVELNQSKINISSTPFKQNEFI